MVQILGSTQQAANSKQAEGEKRPVGSQKLATYSETPCLFEDGFPE
ncbi:MAG: hypothetical protein ACOC0K_01315 [bacterium]